MLSNNYYLLSGNILRNLNTLKGQRNLFMISNGLYATGKVWIGANKLISDLYEEKLLFTFNTKPIFLRLAYLSTPVNSFRFKQVANYILGFFSIYHMLPSLHNFRKRSTLSVKYFQGVPFLLMHQPLSCNSI